MNASDRARGERKGIEFERPHELERGDGGREESDFIPSDFLASVP